MARTPAVDIEVGSGWLADRLDSLTSHLAREERLYRRVEVKRGLCRRLTIGASRRDSV
jgi:hypothetical protein